MRPEKKELTEEEKFELELQCEQELGRLARTVIAIFLVNLWDISFHFLGYVCI